MLNCVIIYSPLSQSELVKFFCFAYTFTQHIFFSHFGAWYHWLPFTFIISKNEQDVLWKFPVVEKWTSIGNNIMVCKLWCKFPFMWTFFFCATLLKIKGSLLELVVPWRNLDIHGTFLFHKRFFKVDNFCFVLNVLHTKEKMALLWNPTFGTLNESHWKAFLFRLSPYTCSCRQQNSTKLQ